MRVGSARRMRGFGSTLYNVSGTLGSDKWSTAEQKVLPFAPARTPPLLSREDAKRGRNPHGYHEDDAVRAEQCDDW